MKNVLVLFALVTIACSGSTQTDPSTSREPDIDASPDAAINGDTDGSGGAPDRAPHETRDPGKMAGGNNKQNEGGGATATGGVGEDELGSAGASGEAAAGQGGEGGNHEPELTSCTCNLDCPGALLCAASDEPDVVGYCREPGGDFDEADSLSECGG